MRTENYIANQADRLRAGETARGKCASVWGRGDTVYSYGHHYPLLTRVQRPDGTTIIVCNTAGYSATTGRHISYARRHADVCVPLASRRGASPTRPVSYQDVVDAAERELARCVDNLQAKKRTDTKVYRALQREHERAYQALQALLVPSNLMIEYVS